MPNSNESDPNNAAGVYLLAYETLFAKLTPEVQAKVLQAKGDDPNQWGVEVVRFIKAVVALAESDDKKA